MKATTRLVYCSPVSLPYTIIALANSMSPIIVISCGESADRTWSEATRISHRSPCTPQKPLRSLNRGGQALRLKSSTLGVPSAGFRPDRHDTCHPTPVIDIHSAKQLLVCALDKRYVRYIRERYCRFSHTLSSPHHPNRRARELLIPKATVVPIGLHRRRHNHRLENQRHFHRLLLFRIT